MQTVSLISARETFSEFPSLLFPIPMFPSFSTLLYYISIHPKFHFQTATATAAALTPPTHLIPDLWSCCFLAYCAKSPSFLCLSLFFYFFNTFYSLSLSLSRFLPSTFLLTQVKSNSFCLLVGCCLSSSFSLWENGGIFPPALLVFSFPGGFVGRRG